MLLVLLVLSNIKRSTSSGLCPICCNHLSPATVPICDLLLPVIPLIKSLIGSPATSSDICALGIPLPIAPMALKFIEPI